MQNVKDLVCLQAFNSAELYTAVGWKKKYKAPNEFGFAFKVIWLCKAFSTLVFSLVVLPKILYILFIKIWSNGFSPPKKLLAIGNFATVYGQISINFQSGLLN